MNPFKLISQFLSWMGSSSHDGPEIWDVLGEKVRFSFPAGRVENWQVVEINLDKFMRYARLNQPNGVIDLDNLEGYSSKKIEKITSNLGINQGLMNMPEIYTSGNIHDGLHRLAVLEKMKIKVIPVLVPNGQIPEQFMEKFGVDKKYYREPVKGTYFVVEQGQPYPTAVDIFNPIERAAIKSPPGEYRVAVEPVEAVAVSKHQAMPVMTEKPLEFDPSQPKHLLHIKGQVFELLRDDTKPDQGHYLLITDVIEGHDKSPAERGGGVMQSRVDKADEVSGIILRNAGVYNLMAESLPVDSIWYQTGLHGASFSSASGNASDVLKELERFLVNELDAKVIKGKVWSKDQGVSGPTTEVDNTNTNINGRGSS